jgi:Uma2 family endonuclease
MITLQEVTLMGINAPRSHQRIISKLLTEFGIMFYKEKSMALEPFPETMLDEDKTSPVPDIMLYDNERETTPVIIEVTRTGSVKADLKKVRQLIDSDDYGIEEGFVFDYRKNVWFKYKQGKGDITIKPSFCDTLQLDLAKLLV